MKLDIVPVGVIGRFFICSSKVQLRVVILKSSDLVVPCPWEFKPGEYYDWVLFKGNGKEVKRYLRKLRKGEI